MADDDSKQEMKKDLQRLYIELQLASQQIKEAQRQVQAIDSQLMELEATKMALNDLSGTKADTKMFVPLSSGIYLKAQLKDNKNLLVNVGANTAVKKSIPSTIKLIDEQIEELGKLRQQAIAQLEQLVEYAHRLEHKLQHLAVGNKHHEH